VRLTKTIKLAAHVVLQKLVGNAGAVCCVYSVSRLERQIESLLLRARMRAHVVILAEMLHKLTRETGQ